MVNSSCFEICLRKEYGEPSLLRSAEHIIRMILWLRGYRSHRITSAAGTVHYMVRKCQGDLPPLVLLHGLGSAGAHFGPLLLHLKKRVKKIIIVEKRKILHVVFQGRTNKLVDVPRCLDLTVLNHCIQVDFKLSPEIQLTPVVCPQWPGTQPAVCQYASIQSQP